MSSWRSETTLTTCILLIFTFGLAIASRECVMRHYRQLYGDMSCVCNATYCDDFPPLGRLNVGQAVVYRSSIAGQRFERSPADFRPHDQRSNCSHDEDSNSNERVDVDFTVDLSQRFQKIVGFGGSFTDAAGINLNRLSKGARENLVRSYYADNGIEYTVGRVPMASCDFSTHEYSYCDTSDDFSLSTFNLTEEDFQLKIPFIKEALKYANLSLFASPWSAPGWMKESGRMTGGTALKPPFNGKYYHTWANYFLRFFEEYDKQGLRFWGLTVENEPSAGVFIHYKWQAMYFTAVMMRDFVVEILGPLMKSQELTRSLKIMGHDDSRMLLPLHANVMLQTKTSAKYFDGIAVHWYTDSFTSPKRLTEVHERHPDKFVMATEACAGFVPNFQGPVFGDWYRGEEYARRIIDDLENWVVGWTDWNLCLDEQGGPNFVSNFVDTPIIVNNTVDEFYKQPMYYALGHFSKFIRPGSVRLGHKLKFYGLTPKSRLSATAFLNPSGQVVLAVLNRHSSNQYALHIRASAPSTDAVDAPTLDVMVEPNSIATVVFAVEKPKDAAKRVKSNRTI